VSQQHSSKPPSRIPHFASREEEAAWWDSHDLADYQDEFKTVRARFAKNLSEGITVRLDPETLSELREQARRKGIRPTTLARMWILERLRPSEPRRTPEGAS
jgi:predicted DNA binding CopG/RHH family protein